VIERNFVTRIVASTCADGAFNSPM